MLIKVKVFPCSDEEQVIKKSEDSFEVKVKEEPIRGQANRAVVRALAVYLGIPEGKLRMVKGFTERNKIFDVNY